MKNPVARTSRLAQVKKSEAPRPRGGRLKKCYEKSQNVRFYDVLLRRFSFAAESERRKNLKSES